MLCLFHVKIRLLLIEDVLLEIQPYLYYIVLLYT